MGITNRYQILIAAKLAKEVEGFRGAQTIQGSASMFKFPLAVLTIQGSTLFDGVYYSRKYSIHNEKIVILLT